MEATRFDALVATLSRRAGLRHMGGAALALLLGRNATDAKRKKKRKHRSSRCRPNCDRKLCGDDGCGGSCGTCAGNQTCQGGACVCVAEPPAATCARGCGTLANNCGQAVSCPCPSGQDCLGNGSCARNCTAGAEVCPGACFCTVDASAQRYCGAGFVPCGGTDTCTSDANCPHGQFCARCSPGDPSQGSQCAPLCAT